MDEKSSLLSSGKKDADHGTAEIPRCGSRFGREFYLTFRRCDRRLHITPHNATIVISFHSVAGIEASGVRPSGDSISNIPQVLVPRHRHSLSAGVAAAMEPIHMRHKKRATVGGIGHARAPSFMQALDGSIYSMSESSLSLLYSILFNCSKT
jgi:hypothetical protein